MTSLTPAGLELAKVQDYLRALLGPRATLLSLERLDDTHADDVTKGRGYGVQPATAKSSRSALPTSPFEAW